MKVSPLQTYCRPARNPSSFRVFTLAKQQTYRDVIDFPKRRYSHWRKIEERWSTLAPFEKCPNRPAMEL